MIHVFKDDVEGNTSMLRETLASLAHLCNTVEDSSSGCTAGIAFVTGEHLYLATCGDVQALLVEKGKEALYAPSRRFFSQVRIGFNVH